MLTAIAAGLAGCSSEATASRDNRYNDNRYAAQSAAPSQSRWRGRDARQAASSRRHCRRHQA
jgi:hypothetical protein